MSTSPLEWSRIVLAESHRQLMEMERLYGQSLQSKHAPDRLLLPAKGALENQRSVLDYIAYELVQAYGTKVERTYYPLCSDPTKFDKQASKDLPGVDSYPPALALVRMHQPFVPGHDWMSVLHQRVNPIKHRRLTAQTRSESTRISSGGVSWNPSGVTFGAGVTIGGVPVDPETQRPQGDYTTVTYVDWLFEGTELSVRSTLRTIGAGLRAMLSDFEIELGW